jgi:hypothetical protein
MVSNFRKLSSQLPEAKARLAQHGLVEIQTGSSVLNSQWTDPTLAQDGTNSSEPVMGSVEIAILGMALAVFFGALVAVVSIFCIRAKRFQELSHFVHSHFCMMVIFVLGKNIKCQVTLDKGGGRNNDT